MNENNPPPAPAANGTKLAKLNSPLFIWPTTVALAVLLFFGLGYFFDVLTHESTDDAFIAAHVVSIAPRISGQVAAVHVLDNEMVRSNELLVEIDPSSYSITVAQKEASAEAQSANYKAFLAGYELMRTKVTTAEATVRQSQADADAAEATAKWAQMDFDRAQDLRKQNTVSQRELDAAQTANLKAQADLNSARQKVAVDDSKVDEARATLAATGAAITMALAQWQAAQTNIAAAQLDLSYTKVFALCDGRVTRKAVEPGNYVQVGQQLMSIVPADIWVVANFKESQLKKMKPGQPALVEIDALGKSLRAHVDSIQAGSGAAFSLLPPENATGNYVKVVQRVPVKILFDEPLPADHVIGPGLSVTPDVWVSGFEIPGWVIGLVALVLAFIAGSVFRFVLSRKLNSAQQ
ncbi:MAG: HlyD family secretion protein [Verrucomicrobiota bacterium]|jgi:membrane fusion protein (multidrug efflux system)